MLFVKSGLHSSLKMRKNVVGKKIIKCLQIHLVDILKTYTFVV